MKAFSTKHLLSAVLTASLILASCSSYRQVACPEIDQNNYLARNTSRIHKKAPHRTRQTYAKNLDKLSANKYDGKLHRSTLDKSATAAENAFSDLSTLTPLGAQIQNNEGPDENLLASTGKGSLQAGSSTAGGEALKISGTTGTYGKSGSLELMSRREMRKFTRKYDRELRSSMQVAPRAAGPTTSAKPAKPLAIAALVLGITSFFLFPIVTGTLGIIFGAMAMKRIKANPNQEGKGMAKAGMICGVIGLAAWILLITIGYGALGLF